MSTMARVSLFSLSFALAASLAACSSGKDGQAPADRSVAKAAAAGGGAQVTGAGSTFIFPLVSRWSTDYNAATGAKVNYQSIGSGGGIAQVKAGTVDFGASDKPLAGDELASAGLVQFPIAIGGVVPVVNLEGITPGALRLTGPVLADIFAGRLARWNDPAIAALNPGKTLPDTKITVVHHSDGSGSTYNFTNYLSKVSPSWKGSIGEGTTVQWPTGMGGKGNEGVASYVKQVKGGIGYVELAYALQNRMPYAALQNAAGNWVQPGADTFQSAAASADWTSAQDFNLVITNASGAQAWPITATTFVLMPRQPRDAKRSADALAFFRWALENGQPQAKALDYVPLPPDLVQQVEAYWAAQLKS